MEIFTFENGEIKTSDSNPDQCYIRIPLSYELIANELPTITGVTVHAIHCMNASNRKISLNTTASPRLLVEDDNGEIFSPKMPLLLRPDNNGFNKIKIILEIEIKPEDVPKFSEYRHQIVILFSQIIGTGPPITFQVKGQFTTTTAFTAKVRRHKYPHLVFLNMALFGIPTILFQIWNNTLNTGVYGTTWLPNTHLLTMTISFLVGFLGVHVVIRSNRLRSLSGIIALYKYPEIYLNSATVRLFRMKTASILFVLLLSVYSLAIYKHPIIALPDKATLGKDFVIVDSRIKNDCAIVHEKKAYAREIPNLYIRHHHNHTGKPVCYAKLTLQPDPKIHLRVAEPAVLQWQDFKIQYPGSNEVINIPGNKIEASPQILLAKNEIMAKLRGYNLPGSGYAVTLTPFKGEEGGLLVSVTEKKTIDPTRLLNDLLMIVEAQAKDIEKFLHCPAYTGFKESIHKAEEKSQNREPAAQTAVRTPDLYSVAGEMMQ